MKKGLLLLLFVALLSCENNSNKINWDELVEDTSVSTKKPVVKLSEEEKKAKEEERQAGIKKLKSKFNEKVDDFSDQSWVRHKSSPKYTNRNAIFLYFSGATDKPCGEGVRMLTQNCC